MNDLVTIGVPVYKRLQYLPNVLRILQAQDYPCIELIISDNGLNGPELSEMIKANYALPFRLRRNAATVNVAKHFNQIISEAAGEFTVILADDDEISPNYITELVAQFKADPTVSAAIARQEIIDAQGALVRGSSASLPDSLAGEEFVKATWGRNQFRFECFATFLARTKDLRACGGYGDFTRGTNNDNALLLKLALGRRIAFNSKCVFRWRVDDSSYGWSVTIQDLAAACREFLYFLDSDSMIQDYAQAQPAKWAELKACLVEMTWKTYFWRWKDIYRKRLTRSAWARAAFSLPFIKSYYRQVVSVFVDDSRSAVKAGFKSLLAK